MGPFLTARWQDLVAVNFAVDPSLLEPLVPTGTQLDLWQGEALASLVAFRFLDTRVRGLRVPGHVDFDEVNLRFYVRRVVGEEVRRGVVFVREFVPKPAIAWVARYLYGEPYETRPMSSNVAQEGPLRRLTYAWGESRLSCAVDGPALDLPVGSEAEFIFEHYWGYTQRSGHRTSEYEVTHPRWHCWTAEELILSEGFVACYGGEWASALARPWRSAFVAKGSEVAVMPGETLVGP